MKNKNKMNKEFVPYKIRTALIELGYNYDAVCYHRGDMKKKPIISEETAVRIHGGCDCLNYPAILYQQAFRFFREKHGLFVQPNQTKDKNGNWYYFYITGIKKRTIITEGSFKYEEEELDCLKKLIEIVKQK